MHLVSILVQKPTVGGLEEIVKVVLRTAHGPAHASSVGDVHALLPAIISTKSQEEVTTVFSKPISEVLGTSPDIVTDISAVSTRGVTTLVVGQLHKTLFASTADCAGVAATLLESDRSQEDGRKSEFIAKLLKGPNIRVAGGEGTALSDGIVEIDGDEISDPDEGRVPPSTLDTTIQPIEGSIGTGGSGDFLGSTVGPAPIILNLDEAISVGARVALGLIIL